MVVNKVVLFGIATLISGSVFFCQTESAEAQQACPPANLRQRVVQLVAPGRYEARARAQGRTRSTATTSFVSTQIPQQFQNQVNSIQLSLEGVRREVTGVKGGEVQSIQELREVLRRIEEKLQENNNGTEDPDNNNEAAANSNGQLNPNFVETRFTDSPF